MAEHAQIERIAQDVVNANTAPDSVVSVSTRDALDWTGDSIVRVSIVLTEESAEKLRNDTPLNILTQLIAGLENAGETRFPIIDYATPAELSDEALAASENDDY